MRMESRPFPSPCKTFFGCREAQLHGRLPGEGQAWKEEGGRGEVVGGRGNRPHEFQKKEALGGNYSMRNMNIQAPVQQDTGTSTSGNLPGTVHAT